MIRPARSFPARTVPGAAGASFSSTAVPAPHSPAADSIPNTSPESMAPNTSMLTPKAVAQGMSRPYIVISFTVTLPPARSVST